MLVTSMVSLSSQDKRARIKCFAQSSHLKRLELILLLSQHIFLYIVFEGKYFKLVFQRSPGSHLLTNIGYGLLRQVL